MKIYLLILLLLLGSVIIPGVHAQEHVDINTQISAEDKQMFERFLHQCLRYTTL